jgi:hypothetical protein
MLDAADLDLQTQAIVGGENPNDYDLNHDRVVDYGDRVVWIKNLQNTWIGDANLDGEFNSGDLVSVLASGSYEADFVSSWSTGDFNGDGRSNSTDLVAALADGGYELGPRPVAIVVSEPTSLVIVFVGLIGTAICRFHTGSCPYTKAGT